MMAIKIFISCEYQNNEKDYIDELINSLKVKGYEIINESTIGSNNLEQNYKLIDQCDWFILIMTKKSIEQNSHCLRELLHAKEKNIDKVLPIMCGKIDLPPMSLQKTQWVAFSQKNDEIEKYDEYFDEKIKEIDAILSGKVNKNTKYKIFISYGHDKYAGTLIKRLAKDLNDKGMPCWVDFDYLHGGVDWEFKIQDGIDRSKYVIVFVTPHSMRQPKGYCLNEISYSNALEKKILRINVELAQVPLSIINVPKLDFSNCVGEDGNIIEDKYQINKKLLIEALDDGLCSLQKIVFANNKLYEELKPIENVKYIQLVSSFVGREWLLDKYNEWLNNKDSKVWCVLGGAGTGKSAFISNLCQKEHNIKAVHYCKFGEGPRANPKNVIMSLAYQLSTRFEKYKAILTELPKLKYSELIDMSIDELFDYLIVDPLYDIDLEDEEPIVLVIDAIDEATKNDGLQNDLINFISNKFYNTPKWLKLIITSRPETNITSSLGVYNTIRIEQDKHHTLDVLQFLRQNILEFIDDFSIEEQNEKVAKILKMSEGNFVYVDRIIKSLKEHKYDIKNIGSFPKGLSGFFKEQFNSRLFKDVESYEKKFKPILQIILCSYEPLNNANIAKILSTTISDINKKAEYMEDFFPQKDGFITPFHKSIIDWLFDQSLSTSNYCIVKEDAHKLLSDHYYQKYKNDDLDDYGIKYLAKHCLESNDALKTLELLVNGDIQNRRIELLGKNDAIKEYFNEIYKLSCLNKRLALKVFNSDVFVSIFSKYRNYLATTDLYVLLSKCGFDEIIGLCDAWKVSPEYLISCEYYLLANDRTSLAQQIKWQGERPKDMMIWRRKMLMYKKQHRDVFAEREINTALVYLRSGAIGYAIRFCLDVELMYNYQLGRNLSPNVDHLVKNLEDYFVVSKAYKIYGDILFYTLKFDLMNEYYSHSIKLLEESKEITSDENVLKDIESLIIERKSWYFLTNIWNFIVANKNIPINEISDFLQKYDNPKYKFKFSSLFFLDLITHICKGDLTYIDTFEKIAIKAKNNDDLFKIAFCYCLKCLINNEKDKIKDCLQKVLKQTKTENVWNFALVFPIIGRLCNEKDYLNVDLIYKWFKDCIFDSKHVIQKDEFDCLFSDLIKSWIKFNDSFIKKIITNVKNRK